MTTYSSEQEFKNTLKEYLEFYGLHCQRHEDKYETGIPDLSYGGGRVNGWIETKWEHIRFEKKQPLWLSKRAMTGGFVWVIVGYRNAVKIINWRTMELRVWKGDIPDWIKDLIDLLCDPATQGTATPQLDRLPPGFHRELEKYLHPVSPESE